jgi:hypothetical protein
MIHANSINVEEESLKLVARQFESGLYARQTKARCIRYRDVGEGDADS